MVDGVIVLYDQNETSFTTNGLGYLPDATECIVTEELNGEFELQMEYPINGLRYKEIQHRRILLVKTNPYEDPQPFRIYNINKPIDGLVEVNARHISYDLSGYALPWIDDGEGGKSALPFATGPASFMTNFPNLVNQLNSGMPQFTYWTNSTEDWPRNPSGGSEAEKENELKEPHWIFVDQPMNARNLIGQFTEKYKGEFKWDKFDVQFYGPVAGQSEDDTRYRGKDSGVVLRYGKNLTDLMQEEDSDKGMYTHIYPYWSGSIEYTKPNGEKGNKETVIELTDKLYPVFNDHTPNYKRIYVYDCTSDYTAELQSKDGQKYPSEETLREMCDKLIKDNKLGTPNITLTASFVQLSKSVEYKDLALLEKILLGDTVTVYFPDLDVDSTLKCTSVEYNVLTDEYRTITLGESNTSVSNTIANTASMSSSNSTAIAGSATKNDVFGKSYDTALSTTSENAVQNKVITNKIRQTDTRVEECFTSVSNGKRLLAEAITEKGVDTSSTDTFSQMHDNILEIPSGGSSGVVYNTNLVSDYVKARHGNYNTAVENSVKSFRTNSKNILSPSNFRCDVAIPADLSEFTSPSTWHGLCPDSGGNSGASIISYNKFNFTRKTTIIAIGRINASVDGRYDCQITINNSNASQSWNNYVALYNVGHTVGDFLAVWHVDLIGEYYLGFFSDDSQDVVLTDYIFM